MCFSAPRTICSAISSVVLETVRVISSDSSLLILGMEPKLTPMRMGTWRSLALVTTSRTYSSFSMLPGLRRRAGIPASSAASARR